MGNFKIYWYPNNQRKILPDKMWRDAKTIKHGMLD